MNNRTAAFCMGLGLIWSLAASALAQTPDRPALAGNWMKGAYGVDGENVAFYAGAFNGTLTYQNAEKARDYLVVEKVGKQGQTVRLLDSAEYWYRNTSGVNTVFVVGWRNKTQPQGRWVAVRVSNGKMDYLQNDRSGRRGLASESWGWPANHQRDRSRMGLDVEVEGNDFKWRFVVIKK
jgi:hypothetical protein